MPTVTYYPEIARFTYYTVHKITTYIYAIIYGTSYRAIWRQRHFWPMLLLLMFYCWYFVHIESRVNTDRTYTTPLYYCFHIGAVCIAID